MSSEATVQVLTTSVDRPGLSVVSATKLNASPRVGGMYNPDTLAAAIPVWFHPLQSGSYVALLREHWTGGTIGSTGPQSYSTKTVSTVPTWVTVDALTGATTGKATIPSDLSGTRVLNAAVSRLDSIYTIGGVDGVPHLAQHRVDPGGQLVLQAEELIPVVDDVSFSAGVYIDKYSIVLIGVGPGNQVYRARKSWGKVGQLQKSSWEYKGAKGWYADIAELDPEPGLTTDGMVSYAKVRDREWLSTHASGVVKFWSSRMVEPAWTGGVVPDVTTDHLYLQPQINHNPLALAEGFKAAVPYVATKPVNTAGATALLVAWGVLPV